MKANEFIKKFGWCEASSVLLKSDYHNEVDVYLAETKEFTYIAIPPDENDPFVSLKELKALIESHALIKSCGGLEQAKAYAIDANACGAFNDELKLKQAILDVESCQ